MKLIDKSALVAEIEKKKKSLPWGSCASQISMECNCKNEAYDEIENFIDSLPEEPVSSVWHNASEEPTDKANCLIYYKVGDKVSYQDVFPVLYHKERKEFVTESYPHPTVYKVEQKSLEGGATAVVYKNMRDKFPLTDISKWAYLEDLLYKQEEPVSEDLDKAAHNNSVELLNDAHFMDNTETFGELLGKLQNLFKAGANWQKNHIWHDVLEPPTSMGDDIIVLCRNNNMEDGIWLADLIMYEGKYEPRANWERPLLWAYVRDILPNKED